MQITEGGNTLVFETSRVSLVRTFITASCSEARPDVGVHAHLDRFCGLGVTIVRVDHFGSYLKLLWKMEKRPVDLQLLRTHRETKTTVFRLQQSPRWAPSCEGVPECAHPRRRPFPRDIITKELPS